MKKLSKILCKISKKLKKKCHFKAQFVRGEHGEDEAYVTITMSQKSVYHPIDEQNELDHEIHEDPQRESGFRFDSVKELKKIF